MTLIRTTAALLLGAAALLPQPASAQADPAEAQRLHALFEAQWEALAREHPEWATFRGDHRFDDRWTDNRPAAREQRDRAARERLQQLRAIDRTKLGATDLVSLDMALERLQREVRHQAFAGYRTMSVGSMRGPHTALPEVLRFNANSTRPQVEQMLARVGAFPAFIDQEINNLREGMRLGWVPSKPVLQRALITLDGLLGAPEASPIMEPFKTLGSAIPLDEQRQLRERALKLIGEQAQPALRRLRDFLAGPYLAAAPAEGAYSGYPGGAEVYAALVQEHTTTALTPDQIHAMGLELVGQLRRQMEEVMRSSGFTGGWDAFLSYLNSDPKFFHASPEAMLAGYREIAKRIDPELPKLFAELPRLPYGIRSMPAYLGPGAAANYSRGSADGTRAGWFNANTQAYKATPTWSMETLVAHEAAPGHHLQTARALELRDLPAFRRSAFYTAYGEGWALYAETLGSELGLYTDPYSRFGHLQAQMFRAVRLVVDTGLHAKGWTRQQALSYMIEQTGMDAGSMAAEVDRYLSNPGQALAYMVGQQRILALRERAKQALKSRFDIRQFHHVILDQGPMPLDVLERQVDAWIQRSGAVVAEVAR
ncbi:DUF885 domain-containing protein [Aquincola sp. S2]|uniref:DUF885 domain-containing protein n=1 Tax=Pseudaquabacterium terrae TaxID=2732868 RepID=A0ABX2EQI4_9BURK|nr:DUF885 domain-containing protein [Aquabacterium terrae]NRF70858.1 DUF885 domain-containing protein [Aquabacterium terrae]